MWNILRSIKKRAARLLLRKGAGLNIQDLFTPLPEAVHILEKRRLDSRLKKEVEDYMKGVPAYFKENKGVLYLARHVATPNFETLRFLSLCEPYTDMISVIGQDSKDIFTGNNSLKRSLGKMPIIRRDSPPGKFTIQHETVVEFNNSQGKKLRNIKTTWGESLITFHNNLFKELYPGKVSIKDDFLWIDKHRRGDLLGHYKYLLSLFIVHGIMFEWFPQNNVDESRFFEEVFQPAFSFVHKKFGYRPLITSLVSTSRESEKNWEAYPAETSTILQKKKESLGGK